MPSKGCSKKPALDAKKQQPTTPVKQKSQPTQEASETPKSKKRSPTKKISVEWKSLDGESTIPVDVKMETDNGQAIPGKSKYGQLLKLEASSSFSLTKTIMLKDGPYAGYQAIIVCPAKPFEFLKLPDQVKTRVYRFYFACRGTINEPIVVDGKRSTNKEVFAKTYAQSSKDRVALLCTNKEINKQATAVFYAQTLKFENTASLIDFLSQVPASVRPRLTSIEVKAFQKTTGRNAMHFLAEAPNLQHLRFEVGITAESEPAKAAKAFYNDAYKFLEAIGSAKGNKTSGVDVLSFAKTALTTKNDKKETMNWPDSKVEQFKECLRAKIRGEL